MEQTKEERIKAYVEKWEKWLKKERSLDDPSQYGNNGEPAQPEDSDVDEVPFEDHQ